MRRLIPILMILPLAACDNLVSRGFTGTTDLRVGDGYRGADDPCRRVGYSDATAPFMNLGDDLVGCPVGFEGRAAFQVKTGGREVTRTEDWVIYRVPLVGAPPL